MYHSSLTAADFFCKNNILFIFLLFFGAYFAYCTKESRYKIKKNKGEKIWKKKNAKILQQLKK